MGPNQLVILIDDHSRVNIAAQARRVTLGSQVVDTFLAAFTRWGAPASVLTDNGAVFTGKQRGQGRVALEVQLGLRGIRLHHSRPYHPQTCGKVERFHQTQKKWLAAQPRPATIGGLQRQLNRFAVYYNTVRPHRALGRRTPAQAYQARPKAVPTGPIIPTHCRVRTDKIDSGGSVTVRHNSRLHHIGLGARLAGTPISLLIDDLHIRVIHRHTGALIRELILDPSRDYQPRGLPPGPPKQTAATPPPGIPIPAQPRNRSRSQGWPKATRRAPALTPVRTAPPSPAGMPDNPTNATMSRDTC
jgi:Integrase core domain